MVAVIEGNKNDPSPPLNGNNDSKKRKRTSSVKEDDGNDDEDDDDDNDDDDYYEEEQEEDEDVADFLDIDREEEDDCKWLNGQLSHDKRSRHYSVMNGCAESYFGLKELARHGESSYLHPHDRIKLLS